MKNFLLILLYFINNVLVLSAQGTPGKWGDQGNGTYINPILNADYSDPDVIRVRDKFFPAGITTNNMQEVHGHPQFVTMITNSGSFSVLPKKDYSCQMLSILQALGALYI